MRALERAVRTPILLRQPGKTRLTEAGLDEATMPGGRTAYEVLVIASVIEREAVKNDILDRKMVQFKRMGGQLGYRYSLSPIIWRDGTEEPPPTFADYTPSAAPGNRAPHRWLTDGSSLYDHFGLGFTLLNFGGVDAVRLVDRATERGIPLEEFIPGENDSSALIEQYVRKAALVRSDHHVVWRGDELPDDVDRLLDVITGHASWAVR
jgi:hypothetical protein